MPSESTETPEMGTIRQLVRLMFRYDLTAIDLGDGPSRIRLRRRGAESAHAAPAALPAATSLLQNAASAAASPASIPLASTPVGAVIESPMVGTFYSSSGPDSPAFVSSGTNVRIETTVCIIEAMKVFTEIPAGIAGTVAECLVKNGQSVEYGQPLFRLNP